MPPVTQEIAGLNKALSGDDGGLQLHNPFIKPAIFWRKRWAMSELGGFFRGLGSMDCDT